MFQQADPVWANKKLGESGMTMAHYGCVVAIVAKALSLSGYAVDPGILVDKLNSINGFNDAGELIWAKVSEIYPEFHFGSGDWNFRQGVWHKFVHWLLERNGQYYDSISGDDGQPAGWVATGRTRSASIDPATTPQPAGSSPQPSQPEPKTYEVKRGDSLWRISVKLYGRGGRWQEIFNLNHDIIENKDLIHPGQVLKLPS